MPARLVALACLVIALAAAAGAAEANAAPPQPLKGNPADRLAAKPIDDYRYDHATRCRSKPPKGMLALERWLGLHVRGTSWGTMRCEKLSGRRKGVSPTLAHRDHVHLGLSRAGAAMRTSFWR